MVISKHQSFFSRRQRLLRRVSLAVSLAVLTWLFQVVPASAAINFTIDGSWFCNNRGVVSPVAGARVEFWQQESSWVDWFDKFISNTYTDSNGQYSASFSSGNQHDFYARLALNDDQGARLHNWWTGSSWTIDTGTGSNTSGTIHHDLVISKDGGSSTPKCAIWQGAHNAYQEYVGTVGVRPPDSDYDIALETTIFPTPWTTLSTTHWPDGYNTMGGGPHSLYSVSFHEFGHSVRHSFDGDFSHFLFDATRFGYPRTHNVCDKTNLGFAFNEGWAEFWATDWGARPPDAPCTPTTDMEREGNVAAALYGLSQCPDVGRAGMVSVLQQNPGGIHSFAEFASTFSRSFLLRCELGVSRQGIAIDHNAGEEFAISAEQLAAATQLMIRQQDQVTVSLLHSYQAAVEAAKHVSPCHTVATCDALFQVVTGPPLLAGRIAQSEQVSARLRQDLLQMTNRDRDGDNDDDDTSRTSMGLYAWHEDDQESFDRQTLSTVITATQHALASLEPFEDQDPTGTLASYTVDLTNSLADFKHQRDNGMSPSGSLQSPGGTFGDVVVSCEAPGCSLVA